MQKVLFFLATIATMKGRATMRASFRDYRASDYGDY